MVYKTPVPRSNIQITYLSEKHEYPYCQTYDSSSVQA
jgi:hypothetical protein